MLWSCCEDHQRSQECLSLAAPAARPGELQALPGTPLPCSLPAPGGQDRRDRDLLPVSLEDAPGRAGCCSWYQGTGPALPCPFLFWGGSHGSSSRLGVLGQVFKKGWWPFELASGTGLPLDWGRVLAYPCLSSREGSRKVLGHAGTARSSVGAHGAEQVLGASASPSCLSQKPPQQPRLLPGVLCLFQLSLGRVSVLVLEVFAPMSPWIPLCRGAGAGNCWGPAVPPVCSSGCQGMGDMAGQQLGADSVPKLLLQCCWKGHLELC